MDFTSADDARTAAGNADDMNTDFIYDLTNDLHPIFHRQNFPIDVYYEALEPALRLVSLFIEMLSLLGYWAAVFCGIILPSLTEDGKLYDACFRNGILTDRDIYVASSVLGYLARYVRFSHDSFGLDGTQANKTIWRSDQRGRRHRQQHVSRP